MVNRIGDVYFSAITLEKLEIAAKQSCKSRKDKAEVAEFLRDKDRKLRDLQESLRTHQYRTSEWRMFEKVENGKVRLVSDLPLYPDRIAQRAILNEIEPHLSRKLEYHSHGSRKEHGTHAALMDIQRWIESDPKIKYASQTDFKQFYPSMNTMILKKGIRRFFKDPDLFFFLDEVIDSYPLPGVAIGSCLSAYFGHIYIAVFLRTLKEKHHVHYITVYADDIVILGYSKQWLRRILNVMFTEAGLIDLTIKKNWKIFPVDKQPINFVGYLTTRQEVRIRRRTKQKIRAASARMHAKLEAGEELDSHDMGAIASYKGLLKWSSGEGLYYTYLKDLDDHVHEIQAKQRAERLAKKKAGRKAPDAKANGNKVLS